MRVQYIFVTIACLSIGIFAYDNLKCRKIDFNKINSIDAIESCPGLNEFTLKSFKDNESSIRPYRDDSVYYLSNIMEGWSCFSTADYFELEEDTEFYAAIYLQSMVVDDMSEVQIEIIDLDREIIVPFVNVTAIRDFEWHSYNMKIGRKIENAKISIRAFVTISANFAIQYMHILDPTIDESLCDIDDQTTTDREITTEEQTTAKEETYIEVETETETKTDSCTSDCTCTCSCPLDEIDDHPFIYYI